MNSTYRTNAVTEVLEFKKSLIVWARNQATGYRTQAAIGKTKKNTDYCNAKADGFDFVAKYLEGMEIVDGHTPKATDS